MWWEEEGAFNRSDCQTVLYPVNGPYLPSEECHV